MLIYIMLVRLMNNKNLLDESHDIRSGTGNPLKTTY